MAPANKALERLHVQWTACWEESLAIWSRFTQLHPPVWCFNLKEEKRENLVGSFAMIRLVGHVVVISLRLIQKNGLENFSREIMAHEIGHHVYAPADLTDNARLIARVRAGLPSREDMADLVANLYTDLLINNRLQRSAGLDMAGVYATLAKDQAHDRLWTMYMRIYELLWSLENGALAKGKIDAKIAGDAQLGARLAQVYAREWLDGAGRFAALCLPYLLADRARNTQAIMGPFMDSGQAGEAEDVPDGLAAVDPQEQEGAVHPAFDPELGASEGEGEGQGEEDEQEEQQGSGLGASRNKGPGGKKNPYRPPQEYVEIMKTLGVKVDPKDMVARYYREHALPHLISFPSRKMPEATDPLPEGEETWDIGSPLGAVDWIGSLTRSPRIVPGVTTVRKVFGTTAGNEPKRKPLDLYLGIDCSGSMPNPAVLFSFPVLAGTIMALSALRAGAHAMAVLSGEPGEHSSTDGFTRSEQEILRTLTGYLGTGYAFGIQRLKDAFLSGKKIERKTHILVISDMDIFSMLGSLKNGWEIAQQALDAAGGGGTFVLHRVNMEFYQVGKMREIGWDVHCLEDWESLVDFARKFSRKTYEEKS